MDPNKLSEDGSISLGASSFSEDGKYWAFALKYGGSDWSTVFIKNVDARSNF